MFDSVDNPAVTAKVYQNAGNREVLQWVPGNARQVLDVGCGAGDNARALSGRVGLIDGITLSEEEAAIAKAYCRQVVVHNLETGLPSILAGPYDAVIASHVLEHICYPESLLRDISQCLSERGVLIVALPNLLNWRHRVAMFFGKFEYANSGIMDNTHFRWYTFKSARRLLEANGFEISRAYADGYFPLPGLRKLGFRSLATRLDSAVCALFPGLFGYQLLYVAQKRAAPR
jgi:2-polyprenyl-3-methyl-5-hydroxy-6-metoxy-1,4-benzoquinol methylase